MTNKDYQEELENFMKKVDKWLKMFVESGNYLNKRLKKLEQEAKKASTFSFQKPNLGLDTLIQQIKTKAENIVNQYQSNINKIINDYKEYIISEFDKGINEINKVKRYFVNITKDIQNKRNKDRNPF